MKTRLTQINTWEWSLRAISGRTSSSFASGGNRMLLHPGQLPKSSWNSFYNLPRRKTATYNDNKTLKYTNSSKATTCWYQRHWNIKRVRFKCRGRRPSNKFRLYTIFTFNFLKNAVAGEERTWRQSYFSGSGSVASSGKVKGPHRTPSDRTWFCTAPPGFRYLAEHLHTLGFSSSYNEGKPFWTIYCTRSRTELAGSRPSSWTQFLGNHREHQVRTLDGAGTFNGIGIQNTGWGWNIL